MTDNNTHQGNDPAGGPALHLGNKANAEDCLARDCQDRAAEQDDESKPYCTGYRCQDCEPDDGCCEATCDCCPRVNEHDLCSLAPGSEDDSQFCRQHGEGWLSPLNQRAQRMYDILRNA